MYTNMKRTEPQPCWLCFKHSRFLHICLKALPHDAHTNYTGAKNEEKKTLFRHPSACQRIYAKMIINFDRLAPCSPPRLNWLCTWWREGVWIWSNTAPKTPTPVKRTQQHVRNSQEILCFLVRARRMSDAGLEVVLLTTVLRATTLTKSHTLELIHTWQNMLASPIDVVDLG